MPIPEDILKVERPKNTIVIAYGKDKKLYAVRERIGCKYVNGRRLPINGSTVGHIVNHLYMPIGDEEPKPVSQACIDLKNWANAELCDQLFRDIQPELRKVYSLNDTIKIYCISVLRVCRHGVHDCELQDDYEESFLSELYPGVVLSKNTVSKFINDLGKTCSKIHTFMQNRASAVKADSHLLIDGTLKTDNSVVNSLSEFSRKAKKKGTRDISVLYAFDLEKMEPVCSKCFPGNMLDSVAYEEFIKENGITKGIIVADKGFPEKSAEEQFKAHPDLHYLNPIKRNSKLLKKYTLLKFTKDLKNNEQIAYKKRNAKSRAKANGYILFLICGVQAKRNRTGCLMHISQVTLILMFCTKNGLCLEQLFWNAIWILIRKPFIWLIQNAGRSKSSCVITRPHANLMTPEYMMTIP